MKEVLKELYQLIRAYEPITDVVGNRCYPMIANEMVAYPFCLYGVEDKQKITKDANEYSLYVTVYFAPGNTSEAYLLLDNLMCLAELNDLEYNNPAVGIDPENLSVSATININIIK